MKKMLMRAAAVMMAMGLASACGAAGSSAGTKAAGTEATAAAAGTTAESAAAESTAAKGTSASEGLKTASGKFTVGFDQEFPPMGFIGDNGEYTGYDLALAKAVAEKLGLEFVAQPINWDAKDMELESGNVDCIWNGFTMQGREEAYTWVGPYMANNQVFVVNEDSEIRSIADLSGKAVEVQKDSSGLAALQDEKNGALTAGFASVTEVADYNTALMDLEAGACDAVCMDSIVAGYQITSSGKKMRILDEALSAEEYGIGFKKGDETLAEAVRGALLELSAEGRVAKISEEWFGDASVFMLQ